MKNLSKSPHRAASLLAAALLVSPVLVRAGGSGNLSDSDIERDVKHNLPSALNGRISVSSHDGYITLTGSVISDAQKGWAESAAKQVPQVRGVDDQLKVDNDNYTYGKPNRHSDKWIAMKIKAELAVHKNVSATHTDVDVNQGFVTLAGVADNMAQKELTEEYAKGIDGVRGVRNNIEIRDTNTTFAGDSRNDDRARMDDRNRRDDDGRTVGNRIDDSSITAKVKAQLAGHSSTSALHTHVKTENRVVYISGIANNDAEKDLVTRMAKDVPGVSSVENDMTIGDR